MSGLLQPSFQEAAHNFSQSIIFTAQVNIKEKCLKALKVTLPMTETRHYQKGLITALERLWEQQAKNTNIKIMFKNRTSFQTA